jgi:hypothetical protein
MVDFKNECGLTTIKDIVTTDSTLSRIYGFILYSDRNPYVVKVLQDDAFWNSLNEISGSNWPIFAVRPLRDGCYDCDAPRLGKTNGFYEMVPIWKEPKDNLRVLNDFGLKSSEDFPLFVAFMWDDEDKFHQVSIPIRGKDVDSTYKYLEKIVQTISDTEAKVAPEYKHSVNVFRNVAEQLQSLDAQTVFVENVKLVKSLYDFFSFLKGFFK